MPRKLKLREVSMPTEVRLKSYDDLIRVVIPKLLKAVKQTAYVRGYEASDEEALGLVVSRYLNWDGVAISKAFTEALEDANYHKLNQKIQDLLDTEFNKEL